MIKNWNFRRYRIRKSYVAKNFGYPVFNADVEVGKLYKKIEKFLIS